MQFRPLSALCLAMIVSVSASADEQATDQNFFSLLEEKGFSQKTIDQIKPVSPGKSTKGAVRSDSKSKTPINPLKKRTSRLNSKPKIKTDPYFIERPEPRIIGGTPVPLGERGYQVSLQYGNQHGCGGALIDREWVLTAAHCLGSDGTLSVVLGTRDLSNSGSARHEVGAVYVHPDYDRRTINNDIALLHLAEPVAEDVPLLPLADESIMAEFGMAGSIGTVSGWGVTSTETWALSNLLQQVDLPLVSGDECNASYEAIGVNIPETMLCAGYPDGGYDSCNGDSGGPFTLNVHGEDYSIGVVSWGTGCAEPGFPGVYTRVASFVEWITDVTQSDPYVVEPVEPAELGSVALEAGETRYFKFTPEAMNLLDFEVAAFSETDDVQLTLYRGEFPLETNKICSAVVQSGEGRCGTPIAGQGVYTLALEARGDAVEVQVELSYIDLELGDGSVIDNISLQAGNTLVLHLPIHQYVPVLSISIAGEYGDADLIIDAYNANNEWYSYCDSMQAGSNEDCILENIEPGWITIAIHAWSDFEDVTLSIAFDEPEQPFFPQAICQHSVIQQLGDYFVASINIVNISDQYLDDWYIEWDYSFDTSIATILNGIISGVEPYHAVSAEQGRAIAPGGLTNLYMLVDSPSGLAENPTVTGNYCF